MPLELSAAQRSAASSLGRAPPSAPPRASSKEPNSLPRSAASSLNKGPPPAPPRIAGRRARVGAGRGAGGGPAARRRGGDAACGGGVGAPRGRGAAAAGRGPARGVHRRDGERRRPRGGQGGALIVRGWGIGRNACNNRFGGTEGANDLAAVKARPKLKLGGSRWGIWRRSTCWINFGGTEGVSGLAAPEAGRAVLGRAVGGLPLLRPPRRLLRLHLTWVALYCPGRPGRPSGRRLRSKPENQCPPTLPARLAPPRRRTWAL